MVRGYATTTAATSSQLDLKSALKEAIPEKKKLFMTLRGEYGRKRVGDIKVESVLGGMRSIKCMIWEGSVLDKNEGIKFHGNSIKVSIWDFLVYPLVFFFFFFFLGGEK